MEQRPKRDSVNSGTGFVQEGKESDLVGECLSPFEYFFIGTVGKSLIYLLCRLNFLIDPVQTAKIKVCIKPILSSMMAKSVLFFSFAKFANRCTVYRQNQPLHLELFRGIDRGKRGGDEKDGTREKFQ